MTFNEEHGMLLSSEIDHMLPLIVLISAHCASKKRKERRRSISLFPSIRKLSARYDQLLTASLDKRCFASLYRMSRSSLYELMDKIGKHLVRDNEMARRFSNSVISAQIRLEMTLSFLGGARYQDLFKAHKSGISTVYKVVHDTCIALNAVLKFPGLPKDEAGLRNLANGFKTFRSSASPLTGCIGALGGILVKIACPDKVYNPATFFTRKGYYGLPVQALASHDYRFLIASIKYSGATHDSLCFSVSELGKYLKDQGLPLEIWIVGDEDYICSEFLITPVPMSKAGAWGQVSNYYLSSLRIVVEQAFAILVSKFPVLKNGLKLELTTNCRVFAACMKLHNFIIEHDGFKAISEYSTDSMLKAREHSEDWYEHCGKNAHPIVSEPSKKRSDMIRIVEEMNLTRPYARVVSSM